MTHSVYDALAEDVSNIDWISQPIDPATPAEAVLTVREAALSYDRPWLEETLRRYEPGITIRWFVGEGEWVREGQAMCQITGPARNILAAERAALSFIQLLSGVAMTAHVLIEVVKGTRARILDTRRTLPGLRLAQKYAVRIDGGENHHWGLYDGILIKKNHVTADGGIAPTVRAAQIIGAGMSVQVEIEVLDELTQVLSADTGAILLNNFSLEQTREAVRINNGRANLKVSGGVTKETLRAIAETDVDHISVDGFTKHVRTVDFSLRVEALGT